MSVASRRLLKDSTMAVGVAQGWCVHLRFHSLRVRTVVTCSHPSDSYQTRHELPHALEAQADEEGYIK
eukprot:1413059-Amphidinium_carterae.2